MGAWSVSITGNDTAQDLRMEYTAAFYRYDVDEAVALIDRYIRDDGVDESDEEWCNYYYSLADFMWRKGILTDEIKEKAIGMIDNGFGLEIWAESGEKMLNARKKALAQFREKLLSPLPPKKKIKPDVCLERIFEDGDIVAIQLQTKDKPYTGQKERMMSDEEFHSYDGKYILMRLMSCYASWSSSIVPEVKDYWAFFKLYDGVYDEVPEQVDAQLLKPAKIHESNCIASCFTCESSMYYFKRRKYQLVGHEPVTEDEEEQRGCSIYFGINRPWRNPDSDFLAAMGKELEYGEFTDTQECTEKICRSAIGWGKFNYRLSREENDRIFNEKTDRALQNIATTMNNGGQMLSVRFGGHTVGVVTVQDSRVDDLYIEGRFQQLGFGTQLLKYAFDIVGHGAVTDIPTDNADYKKLAHICEKVGLTKQTSDADAFIRYTNAK